MTPRTLTPAPTDRGMWRRLLRVVHPDTYGDEDLFVWCRHLQEYVTSDHIEESPSYVRRQPPRHHPPQTERLDFTSAYERFASHRDLTRHIVDVAQDYG